MRTKTEAGQGGYRKDHFLVGANRWCSLGTSHPTDLTDLQTLSVRAEYDFMAMGILHNVQDSLQVPESY